MLKPKLNTLEMKKCLFCSINEHVFFMNDIENKKLLKLCRQTYRYFSVNKHQCKTHVKPPTQLIFLTP